MRRRRAAPRAERTPVAGEREVEATEAERQETLAMQPSDDELARAQAALIDSQGALAAARAECARAREEAAVARRRRHAFLAGLAHDLRNPLAPLSNGIELLRLTDADPAGRQRTRGIMERQVGNLMRIADELSDLARLTGEQATLQRVPYALADVLQAAAERARAAAQAQDMTVEVAADATLPALYGDPQRLSEAFGHLLNDLVRHSERGTVLRLSAKTGAAGVDVVVGADSDLAAFAAPGGPALEEADAPALGLGLALCEQLLELHRGTLRADRPAGARRARFSVTLPVAPDAAEPAQEPAAAVVPMSPEPPLAVLLADDNVDFSHSFGTMLELLGHHVEVVHDGLAAVASIVGSPPDIAFIDIGMPSLDGFDAVQRVRGQAHTQDVMLVAVTGRGGAEDRARAAECGFDRYLVKPFAMQDVRAALDAAQAARGRALVQGAGALAPARALA
jgi:signal transduction histidine kinase/CheY-like chemotaxis protein